jgi:hypothetical protein
MNYLPRGSAVIILLWALCASAVASPASDAVGLCLTDSTTGKDRKDLARWIFLAMAAHPEIKDLANASASASEESSRKVAALLTRLIAESCPVQIQQLVRAEGPDSLRTAFEFLGKVAIHELTTNEEVNKSIQQFQRYLDRSKLEAVLAPR